jgi:mRNA-degrading endonuclease RelE of RelBE toxin-antitoxin system
MYGYLYILYNPMFETYGNNVYKLGRTSDLNGRLKHYCTAYVEKSQYLYTSSPFDNCIHAEYTLFHLLRKYRMKNNREFFQCDINEIIGVICVLENMGLKDLSKTYNNIISKNVGLMVNNLEDIKLNKEKKESSYGLERLNYEEFFEKYRFKPKNPEHYFKYGYKTDIRKELVKLSSLAYGQIKEPIDELSEKLQDAIIYDKL